MKYINIIDKLIYGGVAITGLLVIRTMVMEKIDSIMIKTIEKELKKKEDSEKAIRNKQYNESWDLYFSKAMGDVNADAIRWKGDANEN